MKRWDQRELHLKEMPEPTVTFETKCWEKDWRLILGTDYLEVMISRNCHGFNKKVLYINNMADYRVASYYANKLVARGILTEFHVVEEHAKKALEFFGMSKEMFGRGYVYSIAELVGIYLCQTDYLVHFSGDSIMAAESDWVLKSLAQFRKNSRVKVANPTWNMRYDEALEESLDENDDFFFSHGFSDQCYLIRTIDFKAPIYEEKNQASERYPKYGGELFEKRVDAWMRNNGLFRITFKHHSYIHPSFTRAN